jgi:predicted aminopeptidase
MKNLTSLIPGYSAYQSMESRRDDDRLTREFLAKRINDCKDRLDRLGSDAVSGGDWETPQAIERLRGELDRARSRIVAAVEGYSGWFSSRTVDAALLEQVAQLDETLVSIVDLIDKALSEQPLPIAQLGESIQLLHQRIDRRSALLQSN